MQSLIVYPSGAPHQASDSIRQSSKLYFASTCVKTFLPDMYPAFKRLLTFGCTQQLVAAHCSHEIPLVSPCISAPKVYQDSTG